MPELNLIQILVRWSASRFVFHIYFFHIGFEVKACIIQESLKMVIQCHTISTWIVGYILAICIYVSWIFLLAAQAKERIHRLVQSGVESGARLVLDGRNIVVALIFSFIFIISYFIHGHFHTFSCMINLPLQSLA